MCGPDARYSPLPTSSLLSAAFLFPTFFSLVRSFCVHLSPFLLFLFLLAFLLACLLFHSFIHSFIHSFGACLSFLSVSVILIGLLCSSKKLLSCVVPINSRRRTHAARVSTRRSEQLAGSRHGITPLLHGEGGAAVRCSLEFLKIRAIS